MSIFKNRNYEVKELTYAEMIRIIELQERDKIKNSKQDKEEGIEAKSIMQKINTEAKSELAPWITENH